jgi:hypothetical protein
VPATLVCPRNHSASLIALSQPVHEDPEQVPGATELLDPI